MFWNLFNNVSKKTSGSDAMALSSSSSFTETADESKKPSLEYSETIFLNLFRKHPYKRNDVFPSYLQYELEIINIPTFFDEVLNQGLLAPASTEDILNMLKLSDLKEILAEHNLKKSGNKANLIQRIIENIDISLLPIMQQDFFSLSREGELFLEKHSDYIKLRQHPEWGIGFWEYQNIKDLSSGAIDFNQIILSLLNNKIKSLAKKKFDMSQYEYSKLHELYLSCYRIFNEDENLIAALKALLSSALLSVSGCENFWLISYKQGLNLKNSQIMQYYKPIHIHPYVAANILALQEYYTADIAKDVYDNFIGPYNLCTFEIFCQIINELFSSSILDLSPYDNIIKPIFIKKLT